MARKPAPPADTARRIWLAGIGAYGRAFSEAQESIAKLSGDTSRVFEDLVEKGEEIEQKVEAQSRKMAKNVSQGGHTLDERIKRMRERIGIHDESDALDELAERLGRIEEKLDRLLAEKAPAKRATARKKKTRKSA